MDKEKSGAIDNGTKLLQMKYSTIFYVGCFTNLSKLPRQVLCLKMCIATQHTQILVPGDAGNFHDIQPFLEQPGGGLMAQVVESQVLDTGPAYGADIGTLDGLGGEAGEDRAMQAAGQGAQYPDGSRR